jgi:hypothetical protein
MKESLKYIFWGIILLLLFHIETLYIGPIKISHLWKGLLLIYFFVEIILRKQKTFFYKPLIWISFLQLINIELFNNPLNAFVDFTAILILPFFGIYILRFNYSQLRKLLLFFSAFYILSFIPYNLGILNSFREGYDLIEFGGTEGLIGPFQGPHGAAISLAGALVVVLYFWFEGSFNKLYLTILFLLGFYFLLNTYVRTGLAMFAIGSIPTLIYFAKKQARTFLQLAIFAFFMAILASNWILNNEVLMNRITGQSQYSSEESFESIGSGRGGIYIASLQIFAEANIIEKAFGIGQSEQINRIQKKIGLSVGSHNGFLDLLLKNGLLGLLFFFIYIYRVTRNNTKEYYGQPSTLFNSLLLSFLTMTFVQGFEWLTFNVLFMLSIAITQKRKQQLIDGKKNSTN